MQIFVKDFSGKMLTIYVNETDTVLYLKYQVQLKTGVFHSFQRLIHNGQQVEDNKTMIDYNIKRDTTIQLLGRLRSNNINDHIIFSNFTPFELIEPDHIFVFKFQNVDKIDLDRAVTVIIDNKIIPMKITNDIIQLDSGIILYKLYCKPFNPLPYGGNGIIIVDGYAFSNEYGDFGDKYISNFYIK